jgi:hypothetical protein
MKAGGVIPISVYGVEEVLFALGIYQREADMDGKDLMHMLMPVGAGVGLGILVLLIYAFVRFA